MDIKQENNKTVTGSYIATVLVDNVHIDLKGRFELPDPGSQASLDLAVELQIKNTIRVTVHQADRDALPAGEARE